MALTSAVPVSWPMATVRGREGAGAVSREEVARTGRGEAVSRDEARVDKSEEKEGERSWGQHSFEETTSRLQARRISRISSCGWFPHALLHAGSRPSAGSTGRALRRS